MTKLLLAITTVLSLFLVSCDNSNYKQGHDNGYNKGTLDGYNKGQQDGQKAGYDQGYNDGFEKSHKDVTIVDSNTKYFYDTSYLIFTYGFYSVFVLIMLLILVLSIIGRDQDGIIIFLVVALGLAYLSMQIVDLNNIIFFKIEGSWGWAVIIALFPIVIFLSWIVEELLSSESVYLEIFVTCLSTFILFYFGLFLTDIKLYLISNQFYSSCIISATMGGLIYSGYKIIGDRLVSLKVEKKDKKE